MSDERGLQSFRGKRVVITGGAGFIGSSLAIRLADLTRELVLVDIFRDGCGGARCNLSPIEGAFTFHEADIGDAAVMGDILRDADFVFDLAGRVSHKRSMTHPEDDIYDNATAHLSLLQAARVACPGAPLVFAGTRGQFGRTPSQPIDESHPQNPIDVNGVSKMAGEALFLMHHRAWGLRTRSLRLSNTFGPRQHLETPALGVLNWFLRQIIDGEPITLYDGGRQVRDVHHVDDVVSALCAVVTNPSTAGEAYNLGGTPLSLAEFARLAVEVNGGGDIVETPMPAELRKIEIGDYIANTAKIRAHTGWAPTKTCDLRPAIESTLEFYREHKEQYWGKT